MKLEQLQALAKADLRRFHPTVIVEDESPREPELWLCGKCGTYWPRTAEFFYRGTDGKYHSPCRACVLEQKQQMHATRPCAVKGCTAPRHQFPSGKYTSYCTEHLYHKRQKAKKLHVVSNSNPD